MANQYTSYDVVGKKEDISDVISNISPTKTPFQTMIGGDTADNTVFQWQEDSLRDAAANAQVEGFTASADRALPRLRCAATHADHAGHLPGLRLDHDRVKKYGRAKESAYQAGKLPLL
jgi:hypothetical protein